MVAATLGNFWSFPHTLVYSEPSRLAALGLVTETRESEGRRRRIFTVTQAGLEALTAWLRQPVDAPTELRDLGLLQLFFMDLAPDEDRLRLAERQLAMHEARLSGYEEDARLERGGRLPGAGSRTVEHWRGATLPMGLLYERAAVAFWAQVAQDAAERRVAETAGGPSGSGPPHQRARAPGQARQVEQDRMERRSERGR
jgi:PadR family transcriptional regulator, regulatory protein AphA